MKALADDKISDNEGPYFHGDPPKKAESDNLYNDGGTVVYTPWYPYNYWPTITYPWVGKSKKKKDYDYTMEGEAESMSKMIQNLLEDLEGKRLKLTITVIEK